MATLREIELMQSLERRDARILELERDAARYRWLADEKAAYGIAIVSGLDVIDYGQSGVARTYKNELTGEDADKAIDAAMQEPQ